jgi:hypothetical protein
MAHSSNAAQVLLLQNGCPTKILPTLTVPFSPIGLL